MEPRTYVQGIFEPPFSLIHSWNVNIQLIYSLQSQCLFIKRGNFLSYFTVFCNKKYGQICQISFMRCLRSNHGESTFALSSRPCPVPIYRFAAGLWNLSVQSRWVWRAVWGETFTHGSVRGWGWSSLALLDLVLYAASRYISYCPPENASIKLCGFSADTCVASCRYLRRPMQVSAFLGAVSYVFQTINLHLLVESARYKVSTNPPNRTIWFVDDPLWFVDAVFFIYKHPTSVKTTSISTLFPQNPCTIQINALPLHRQSSPSLLTMLNRRQTESNVKLVWTLPRCEGGRDY